MFQPQFQPQVITAFTRSHADHCNLDSNLITCFCFNFVGNYLGQSLVSFRQREQMNNKVESIRWLFPNMHCKTFKERTHVGHPFPNSFKITGRATYYHLKVLCSQFDLVPDCGLAKVVIYLKPSSPVI